MDVVQKMNALLLKTPERQRNTSIISTPGLPMVENDGKTTTIIHSTPNTMTDLMAFPPSPQAGPYAVMVPHRIFVGGFPAMTTEHELRSYFERYGVVREVKIIRDELSENNTNTNTNMHTGTKVKYNYGFVTFQSEEEARHIVAMNKAENGRAFIFQGRYLNVNEAIKKPPFNKNLRLDTALSVPPSGLVLRDANGHLITVYPAYNALPNIDPYAVQQGVPMQQSVYPFYLQPQPVYQMAPSMPIQSLPPLPPSSSTGQISQMSTYAQVAGSQVACQPPPTNYYQS